MLDRELPGTKPFPQRVITAVTGFFRSQSGRFRNKDDLLLARYVDTVVTTNTVEALSALQAPILNRIGEGQEESLARALRKINTGTSEWQAEHAQNLTMRALEKLLDLDPTTVRAQRFIDTCGSFAGMNSAAQVRGVKFLITFQETILVKVGELQRSTDTPTALRAGRWLAAMTYVTTKIAELARSNDTPNATEASSHAAKFLKRSGITVFWGQPDILS